MKKEIDELRAELLRTRIELNMLYEIGNAMRTTLELEQILYIILTAVTCGEGLGFNRAMLFLVNKERNTLEGKMGIGPNSAEEAAHIWDGIESQKIGLDELISEHGKFIRSPNRFNEIIKSFAIPLTEAQDVLVMTALEGMPFKIIDNEIRSRVRIALNDYVRLEHFVTVPLKGKGEILGVLLVDNIFTKKPIDNSEVRLLTMFASHAGLAIENSRFYERTVHLAKTDWLTDLWNYGYFCELLTTHFRTAQERRTSLNMSVADLDNFKLFNDTYGHIKGNEALKKVAQILKERSRKDDIIARYGGEEFVIITPHATRDEMLMMAERFRAAIEQSFADVPLPNGTSLTISFGIAHYPTDAVSSEELLQKADQALYTAKKAGKNRVCLYDKTLAPAPSDILPR